MRNTASSAAGIELETILQENTQVVSWWCLQLWLACGKLVIVLGGVSDSNVGIQNCAGSLFYFGFLVDLSLGSLWNYIHTRIW